MKVDDVYRAISSALGGNGWDLMKHHTKAEAIDYLAGKLARSQERVARLEKAVQVLSGGAL